MKGGPELCLFLCTPYLTAQGERLEITKTAKQQILVLDQVTVFAIDSFHTMLIAIVGTQDPLRPEVIQTVKNCRTVGVVARMVAGDFFARVRAITTRKGYTPRIVARSSPIDKRCHVSFLMECCEVVAVTINNPNNSSTLKQANVGLSMGRCGTELAKMSSDIVIINDNCNSIVSVLK